MWSLKGWTKYVYLDQEVVKGKENQTYKSNRRMRLAWADYFKIDIFKTHLTPESKARIHDQCILPVLTYGQDTWVSSKGILTQCRPKINRSRIAKEMTGSENTAMSQTLSNV